MRRVVPVCVVRRAEPRDISAVAALGEKFFDESGYADLGIEFDRQDFLDTIEHSFDDENNFGIFVAETGGIIGIAGIVVSPLYFNLNHLIAQELFWFIEPESRGGRAGLLLYDALDYVESHGGINEQ